MARRHKVWIMYCLQINVKEKYIYCILDRVKYREDKISVTMTRC